MSVTSEYADVRHHRHIAVNCYTALTIGLTDLVTEGRGRASRECRLSVACGLAIFSSNTIHWELSLVSTVYIKERVFLDLLNED